MNKGEINGGRSCPAEDSDLGMAYDDTRGYFRLWERGTIIASLCFVYVFGIPFLGQAAMTTVDCTNDPNALQPAINNADPGDTLTIKGVCKGKFLIEKDLTLEGAANNPYHKKSGGTLDGQFGDTTLTIQSNVSEVNVILNHLTIRNGQSDEDDSAGGVLIGKTGETIVEMNDVYVVGNKVSGTDSAGGIRVTGGSVLYMYGGKVLSNHATGIDKPTGGVQVFDSSLGVLEGVTISENTAKGDDSSSGGVRVSLGSRGIFKGVIISKNVATSTNPSNGATGGLRCSGGAKCALHFVKIFNNEVQGEGTSGGIRFSGGSDSTLRDVHISRNIARGVGGTGGIRASGESWFTMARTSVDYNQTIGEQSVGGLRTSGKAAANATKSKIERNQASGENTIGGINMTGDGSRFKGSYVVVKENRGKGVGGIQINTNAQGALLDLTKSIVTKNRARNQGVGGILRLNPQAEVNLQKTPVIANRPNNCQGLQSPWCF